MQRGEIASSCVPMEEGAAASRAACLGNKWRAGLTHRCLALGCVRTGTWGPPPQACVRAGTPGNSGSGVKGSWV